MNRLYCLVLCTFLLPTHAKEANEGPWAGSVELGALTTSGNSETRTASGVLKATLDLDHWSNKFLLEVFATSDTEKTTAERYLGDYKAEYLLNEDDYLFGSLRGQRDQFAGFDYRFAETFGYGHHVWNSELRQLDLEIGAGFRQRKLTDDTTETDEVLRGFLGYTHKVFDSAEVSEEFIVLAGDDNTEINSVTALKTKLHERFGLKLSLTVTHNSQVPPDTEKTDTTSAVALVYDFGGE